MLKKNKQFFNYFVEHFKPNPESYLTIPDITKSFMRKNNFFMAKKLTNTKG